jgi:hypothetical protein
MVSAILIAMSSGNGLASTKSLISSLSSTLAYQTRGAIPACAAACWQANSFAGSLITSLR